LHNSSHYISNGEEKMRHSSFLMVTAIFLVLAWCSGKVEIRDYREYFNPPGQIKTTLTIPEKTNIITDESSNINQTLRKVSTAFKYKTDVNGDGLTNCIDAAVSFYQFYPDKNKVRILCNRNPNTGMNHLFNSVLTEGVWVEVEPQAYFSGHPDYFMETSWGNQYDSQYNLDVTEKWKVYAK